MFDARPDAFGSFRVLDEIAAGQFGPVYRAEDAGGGHVVAVKVFDQGLSPEQTVGLGDALARLCQCPLDHPSIVALESAGVDADVAYLAEVYVDGTPLDRLIRRDGPQPIADVLRPITQLAAALDFAAAVGVHHGALHPRDILVSAETMLLSGLGVVEALSTAGFDVPVSGSYASPQRVDAQPTTRADDIYALAAITFELIYGRPVERRADLASWVTPLTGVDHRLLRDVLEGSLSDDPGERPPTALEFAGALQRVVIDDRIPIPILNSDSGDLASEFPTRDAHVLAIGHMPNDSALESPSAPESESELRISMAESESEFESESASASRISDVHSTLFASASGTSVEPRWFGTTAALVIGLLAGFASGFVIGQRATTPPPLSAEIATARPVRPAPADATAATAGQDFTETAVGGGAEAPKPSGADRPGASPLASLGRSTGSTAQSELKRSERLERSERSEQSERSGRILVRSIPSGARVLINGEPRGVTPLAVRALAYGPHTIEVTHIGYQARQQRVTLTADRPAQSVDVALRASGRLKPAATGPQVGAGGGFSRPDPNAPGALHINSRPTGAQVFLDEQLVGTTPLMVSQVTAGAHAVRIEMAGYQVWSTSVTVAAGSRARVAASLER